MNSEASGEGDGKKRSDYESEADRFARHQWNLTFPLNVGILILTAIAAGAVWAQYQALDQTLQETRNDFRASERPYVSMGRKDGTIGNFIVPIPPRKAGIVLYFHNGGHLPALRFNVQLLVIGGMPEFHMARIENIKTGVIRPLAGEKDIAGDSNAASIVDNVIDPKTMGFVQQGDHTVELTGMFEYCGDFGDYTCNYFQVEYVAAPLNAFNLVRIRECQYKYPPIKLSPNEKFVSPCETPEEREQHQEAIQGALNPPP